MQEFGVQLSKQEKRRLAALGTALLLLITTLVPQVGVANWFQPSCECLEVSFLDVGQGDAILIETKDGQRMLVDGGPDATVLKRLGEALPFFDRRIDLVVATHPDADHIGGLTYVLKRYDVRSVLETTNDKESPVTEALEQQVADKKVPVSFAEA